MCATPTFFKRRKNETNNEKEKGQHCCHPFLNTESGCRII